MNTKSLIILACILTCSFSEGLFAGDVPESAKICMDCHGKDGVSTNSDIPTIAGASYVFLEETLFAYKDKIRPVVKSKYRAGDLNRPETDMKQITSKLNYQKVVDIAGYFSSKRFVAAKQDFDVSLVPLGEKVHAELCESCHGEGGRTPDSNAGILAGQWTPYLQATMEHLRDGRRDTDTKMKIAIRNLEDNEWKALLAFYASQSDPL